MKKQYYYNCLDQGLKLYWCTLAKARGLTLHSGSIEWVKLVKDGGAERIFKVDLNEDNLVQSINNLVKLIENNNAPSGILISPSSRPNNIDKILASVGFTVNYNTGSVMAIDLKKDIKEIALKENIEIKQVKNLSDLKVWVNIVNKALFEDELFSYEQFLDLYKLTNTHFYLGLCNGKLASTCMLITENSLATVEMVSTLKEYRKKGLGTAITTVALLDMQKKGIKTAVLRAEKEAINLYKRVGFKEYYKRVVATYNM